MHYMYPMIDEGSGAIVRPVETWPRGADGLVIQSKEDDTEVRRKEVHRRDAMAAELNYADETAGVSKTYDPEGRYNCGRCNKEYEVKCLVVVQKDGRTAIKVDLEAGSCRYWERICAGDAEAWRLYASINLAAYAIAANGVGWGCHRCPWARLAYAPDDMGRALFCTKGNARVDSMACCAINGAETVPIDEDGNPIR